MSVSLSPSSGYCLQFGTGSYFEVAAPDANLSASFTLESWMKTAETDCALIYKLDPGDSDLKQLRLNAMGKLLYTDGSSSLVQTNDSLLVGDNDWHHIAMVYDAFAATGRLYLDGICVAESALTLLDTPGGSLHVDNSSGFTGFIDDIRLWNTARSAEEIQNLMSLIPAWNSPGLIGYWAMNEGNGSQGFDATNYAHIAIINAAWSTNEPGIMLGGVTDNWGEYVISQIPYGNYTTFTVTPSKPGHMFQPEQRLVTLSISNISADNVDFIDNSMIPISGHVTFYGTICPVEGATIWLNGAQAVPLILTDAEGYYVLEVEHGTDCLVSVNYKSHTFDREWDLGVVTYPRTNINFQDTFTTDLFVQVVGGADSYPLGEFNVSLNSVNGLYSREVTGQEWYTGMILIPYIPPLDFNVTVNPAGADPFDLAINDQFQSLKTAHLNLSDADTIADTLRYEWRAPLQVEVAWPPELELKYFATDPGHQYGFYVIGQNEWIELPIRSFEDYTISGYPERRSFLTHCEIEITDEVGAIRDTDDDFGGEEIYTYQFAPYLPNILDGGERPYQNMLQVTLHDPLLNRFASQTDWVITRGVKPTESTFATTSPEIPFLILHDPPGDASYASFRQSSSSSMAMSISYSSARDDGRQVVSHLGPDIVSDIGILYSVQTSFDFTLDIGYGYSCRVTQGDAFETCLTFTSTEEYQTSDQGMLIGRESDLYVGGALNLIWGLTREVVWNDTTQTVSVQDNVMVVPDGFATIYMYTEAQILNNVIPNLITIGDTNSAEMWQSYVEMNTDNIANAVSNPNHPANVSFNAGAGYLYEETASRSSTFTHTFEQVTSEEFGLDAGLVINGLGVTGGFSFEAAVTIGNSQSLAYDTDTTIRYELADNDETSYLNYQPDYFTVDIRTDPVFGTPVFNLLAGASSNRWEQHTLPRDGVNISANTYTATGLQEGETLIVSAQLHNSGGQISSFTLSDISEWLTASVSSGSLLPLETKTIVFTISNQLGYGTFRDTIYADIPALGRESLVFEIRVLADPPAWASTQLSNFDYSMTITGQLFIEGEISHDPNDIIGAFIWDPASQNYLCRGVAALTGVPWLPDSHQFFLTIYSYADAGEELFFRVWDSSTNKEHFGIQEEFSFISGLVYGTPLIPVVIHVSPELYSSINCNAGWNWLSMNLNNTASMSVNSMLASLNPAAGDIVKNQTSYAQFIPTLGWIGSLNTISTVESYKLKLTNPGALNLTGLLEDPITTPIPYGSGWNWIGYLPHVSISVNQALEHIPNAITGDIIKSQSGYSQYIAGYGWFGSMLFMNPGKGYMLKTVNSGSFHYPQYTIPREKPVDTYALDLEKLRQPTSWNVNPLAYEYSSNITAVILDNGMPLVEPNALLAAFYGDECRGLASPVWVIDKWVFFLTQYSNVMNQMLNYKVYFADSGDIFSLAETLPFVNNQVLGDPLAPFEFHLGAADLPIPQNLLMQVSPGSLILSWDGCNGADTYKVFASDDPHGIYVDVTSQGVLGRGLMPLGSGTDVIADPDLNLGPPALRFRITWTCDLPVTNRKFYQVKAVIQRQDK
ncbi:MAG: hypothetical protein KBB33_08045 [Candidatus Cloacimonetes bacterium]|nr:hypothetical protein [Candidatus Cloacimonadota bacterium]